jgi:hypothetical protein
MSEYTVESLTHGNVSLVFTNPSNGIATICFSVNANYPAFYTVYSEIEYALIGAGRITESVQDLIDVAFNTVTDLSASELMAIRTGLEYKGIISEGWLLRS